MCNLFTYTPFDHDFHTTFFSKREKPASAAADSFLSSSLDGPNPWKLLLKLSFCLFKLFAQRSMSFAICSLINNQCYFKTELTVNNNWLLKWHLPAVQTCFWACLSSPLALYWLRLRKLLWMVVLRLCRLAQGCTFASHCPSTSTA